MDKGDNRDSCAAEVEAGLTTSAGVRMDRDAGLADMTKIRVRRSPNHSR